MRKGFTFTELVATIGILSVIGGIASVSYLLYLDNAELRSLEQRVLSFRKAVDLCFLTNGTDANRCVPYEKLKWNCENCTGLRAGNSHPTRGGGSRPGMVLVEIKTKNYSVCARVGSSSNYGPTGRYKTTIKHKRGAKKFCYYSTGRNRIVSQSDGTFPDPNNSVSIYYTRVPFETCNTASDCENSGDICRHDESSGTLNNWGECAEAGDTI